jgi:hypothetical protein
VLPIDLSAPKHLFLRGSFLSGGLTVHFPPDAAGGPGISGIVFSGSGSPLGSARFPGLPVTILSFVGVGFGPLAMSRRTSPFKYAGICVRPASRFPGARPEPPLSPWVSQRVSPPPPSGALILG